MTNANNNTNKENTMDIYCVVYSYFGDLEIIGVFTDKDKAEALADTEPRCSVIKSKLNS